MIVLALNVFSQTNNDVKKIDDKVIGCWKGNEVDGQEIGLTKFWIVNRFEDGTYIMMFTSLKNCIVNSQVEKGTWWVKDEKFYELYSESDIPTIYSYEVLEDKIKFSLISSEVDYENQDVIFYDHKID